MGSILEKTHPAPRHAGRQDMTTAAHPPARGGQPRDTRHERAVARSLVHADLAAQDGDLREALAWLSVLDSMGDPLPAEYERKRRAWHAALRSHAR